MMQKIQRFGGAMFTPVLLFAFSGIMVGFSILFKNPEIMGSLAREERIMVSDMEYHRTGRMDSI